LPAPDGALSPDDNRIALPAAGADRGDADATAATAQLGDECPEDSCA
jgi:hypothetical protein